MLEYCLERSLIPCLGRAKKGVVLARRGGWNRSWKWRDEEANRDRGGKRGRKVYLPKRKGMDRDWKQCRAGKGRRVVPGMREGEKETGIEAVKGFVLESMLS